MKAPIGVYVMWTKPKRAKKAKFFFDYELVVLALSSVFYRHCNNQKTIMYTDTPGYEFFKEKDLLWVWDEINVDVLDEYERNSTFDSFYENAGKMRVMATLPLPYLYIDNDAIVAEKFDERFFDFDIVVAHEEKMFDERFKNNVRIYYPLKEKYIIPDGYEFDPSYNWEESPIFNTALLYFNNQELQDKFKYEYERFLHKNHGEVPKRGRTAQFLFLDQRLLGLIIGPERRYNYNTFLSMVWELGLSTPVENEARGIDYCVNRWHHTWLQKKILNKTFVGQKNYIVQLLDHYYKDIPKEYLEKIKSNKSFETFWNEFEKNCL